MIVGLHGVGKTVLLDRMQKEAEAAGALTLGIEAPEEKALPALLAPQIRQVLLAASRVDRAKVLGHRGLRALSGFISALKVRYQDIELSLDLDLEPGLADAGGLDYDLRSLCECGNRSGGAATHL